MYFNSASGGGYGDGWGEQEEVAGSWFLIKDEKVSGSPEIASTLDLPP